MVNFLKGTVKQVSEQQLTLLVNDMGIALQVPRAERWIEGTVSEIHTYLHWSSDNGPSLFGFGTEVEKEIFLLIISCPKIGPKNALALLSQLTPDQIIEAISAQNVATLSSISGIGEKKSEQIITYLKHKIADLLTKGKLQYTQTETREWQDLNGALISLGYSKAEASKAMQHISKLGNLPFDQLLRTALAYLSRA